MYARMTLVLLYLPVLRTQHAGGRNAWVVAAGSKKGRPDRARVQNMKTVADAAPRPPRIMAARSPLLLIATPLILTALHMDAGHTPPYTLSISN